MTSQPTTFETLKFEMKDGGIGLLTIHRPEALNALNSQVLTDLSHFLEFADRERALKCLVVTGSGEKAFVAGADIKEIAALTPELALRFAERGQKIFRRFEILRMPVIAAVHGFALGGGCELAMSCDFIYASKIAKFGLPEVSLGIMPGFGGTQRAARSVGLPRAREMVFTGRHYGADEAFQMGLVNQVFEPTDLLSKTLEVAQQISTRGPIAIQKAKEAINMGFDLSIDEGMSLERDIFGDLFRTQDQKEGTQAFIEKRKPTFRGA